MNEAAFGTCLLGSRPLGVETGKTRLQQAVISMPEDDKDFTDILRTLLWPIRRILELQQRLEPQLPVGADGKPSILEHVGENDLLQGVSFEAFGTKPSRKGTELSCHGQLVVLRVETASAREAKVSQYWMIVLSSSVKT